MASIIVAIDGGTTSNSYSDLNTANNYFQSARSFCPEWFAAAGVLANGYLVQETSLIWATSVLDKQMEWNGYKATRDQALRWPRSACYDPDGFYLDKSIVPMRIKEITIQFAWELLKTNRMVEPATLGIGFSGNSATGPTKAKIDPDNYLPIIPMYLKAELSWYGQLIGIGERSGMQPRLIRV